MIPQIENLRYVDTAGGRMFLYVGEHKTVKMLRVVRGDHKTVIF